ncbi:hypothetical protein, partial [uncultured Phocaeicola sp.]|uniref:hypothetical protein n=1 Tax=uncultured Phocaeicola sp. TaxID=990718 RepID=UPI0025E5310F
PIILRNSLIIIVRYMMAQKSDEVRADAVYIPERGVYKQGCGMRAAWMSIGPYRGCVCLDLFSQLFD